MFLYSTVLLIDQQAIRYKVRREQGHAFLLFTPEFSEETPIAPPIFWVRKEEEAWVPVNIQDPLLVSQIVEDIREHQVS